MNILVTGAAGYIGSVVTAELSGEGNHVLALDNLQQGHQAAVCPKAEFIRADLGDAAALGSLFWKQKIDAVMHLAADSIVSESVANPAKCFRNNVAGGLNLLEAMRENSVDRLVFSSTAAVYGEPAGAAASERDSLKPVNPYGETKLVFENILRWYGQAYGLRFVALRYFNAAGAAGGFGEDHNPETHLIPNVLKVALGQAQEVQVFGSDYPTPDGSCVRDYIHVSDIAEAHILALKALENSAPNRAYNLGNSRGHSVFEVIQAARRVTGESIPAVVHPRRQGDPAVLVADATLADAELGWQPRLSGIDTIIQSAWEWQKRHPHGYD